MRYMYPERGSVCHQVFVVKSWKKTYRLHSKYIHRNATDRKLKQRAETEAVSSDIQRPYLLRSTVPEYRLVYSAISAQIKAPQLRNPINEWRQSPPTNVHQTGTHKKKRYGISSGCMAKGIISGEARTSISDPTKSARTRRPSLSGQVGVGATSVRSSSPSVRRRNRWTLLTTIMYIHDFWGNRKQKERRLIDEGEERKSGAVLYSLRISFQNLFHLQAESCGIFWIVLHAIMQQKGNHAREKHHIRGDYS